jgi:hypothetical protein
MSEKKEEMVPLSDAEQQVKVTTQRLAMMHLAYAKTLVDKFGWKEGKQLVMNAIKEYGRRVAERTKQGHQSLPKYGFWERREGQPQLCELGKIMVEYDELDLGSLYCLIDPAKVMWADPDKKLIHTKCLASGDTHCEFARDVETTEKEKEDFFGEEKDWAYVDPRLDKLFKEMHPEEEK